MRTSSKRLPFIAAASLYGLVAFLCGACASVSVRGIVEDEHGRPVPHAAVTLTNADSDLAVAHASSDATGCITLSHTVAHDQNLFTVMVEAPRFKPLAFTLSRQEQRPLLITLATASGAQGSTFRPIAPNEQAAIYDGVCIRSAPPAATGIGIR